MKKFNCEKCGHSSTISDVDWMLSTSGKILCISCFKESENQLKMKPNFGNVGDMGWYFVDLEDKNKVIFGPYDSEEKLEKEIFYFGVFDVEKNIKAYGKLNEEFLVEIEKTSKIAI